MTRRQYKMMSYRLAYWIIMVILFYFIIVIASARGGGGGDYYPYSGSGDWILSGGHTWVYNETIEVDGDIYAYGSLTFNHSVTLRFTNPSGAIFYTEGGFYCNNSTIESDYVADWDNWYNVTLNDTIVQGSGWVVSMSNYNNSITNSTFDGYTSAFNYKGSSGYPWPNIEIINNTFVNVTNRFELVDANYSEVLNNDFFSSQNNYTLVNCTNITESGNREFWNLNITLLDAFRQPVKAADIYLYDRDNIELGNYTTDANGRVNWILINEDDSPIAIVSYKAGNTAEAILTMTHDQDFTLIMEDYIPTATIHIYFYNAFTGLGENAELLKVYYREDNGSWQRSSESFSVAYVAGKQIDIGVYDYFNISVSETSITFDNNIKYHVDFSIPLATVHLQNTFGLNEFKIIRHGVGNKMQVMGHEFRIIAAYTGNATLMYTVSWADTKTRIPHNDTEVLIRNGSFSFSAEASESAPHIEQDISAYIEPEYEQVIAFEGGTWWEEEWLRKLLVGVAIIAAIMLPIAIMRNTEWLLERKEKKLRKEGWVKL